MKPDGAADRAAWIRHGAEYLTPTSGPDARADAELLWCRASGEDRSTAALRHGERAPQAALARFLDWLPRFGAGEPLAYLEGRAGFYGLNLAVDARVLVPRPDSESVVELGLDQLEVGAQGWIADLGTGSGCLLLAMLHERPHLRGLGVDRSAEALTVASQNASALGFATRCAFVQSDWMEGVRGPFALILSNPPYVAPGEELGPGVAEYEPHAALFTPRDQPLAAYARILSRAREALAPGGKLIFEVGAGRAQELSALARRQGWTEVGRQRDLGGIERALAFAPRAAQRPESASASR